MSAKMRSPKLVNFVYFQEHFVTIIGHFCAFNIVHYGLYTGLSSYSVSDYGGWL